MSGKKRVIFISLVVLLAAAAFAYFSFLNSGKKLSDNQSAESTMTAANGITASQASTVGQGQQTGVQAGAASTPGTAVGGEAIINNEDIEIRNNTAEYGLKASLREDEAKKTFVAIQFYKDGQSISQQIYEAQIPELSGIFEARGADSDEIGSHTVNCIYLNPAQNKLYIEVLGKAQKEFAQTSIYSCSLGDNNVKRLFSQNGRFTDISFSKDYGRLAFSYENTPSSGKMQESSVLEVVDCKKDDFIIRDSRDSKGKLLGGKDPECIYDYTFAAWLSNNNIKLEQTVEGKDGLSGVKSAGKPGAKPAAKPAATDAATTVLYDIDKNAFIDADGTPIAAGSGQSKAGVNVKSGNEAIKALKDFYSYLASEKYYTKAMELLSGDFSLQIGILQQFGVIEIIKSDIDTKSASEYSNILKQAKIDYIVKADTQKNTATVYYYQTLVLGEDSTVTLALSAEMEKLGGKWTIKTVRDADGTQPPFN